MSKPLSPLLTETTAQIAAVSPVVEYGTVTGVQGMVVTCAGLPNASVGSRCEIRPKDGSRRVGEVIGFQDNKTLIMPFDVTEGIAPQDEVSLTQAGNDVAVSAAWLGRVVNGLGQPIDDLGPLPQSGERMPLRAKAPQASKRQPVGDRLDVGVRVVNTFVPLCKGQRLGIFSGSGVGKSVLMAMMAQYSTADVNVIGLIGERGREVREFIEEQLGPQGLAKSVIIVATGDESPLMRRQAAYLTATVAEYFRNQGKQVFQMMDSVTRVALAQREIGLSAGEPPTTRGYTPSVFAELPKLLERAGPGESSGSITGIFTVLVEGGDLDEPVADAVRGIVDGHIILSRRLAERGQYPAVDVLQSVSRMAPECNTDSENSLINQARSILTTYNDMAELIRLGAYRQGSDPEVDKAIQLHEPLTNYIKQLPAEHATLPDGYAKLGQILQGS